MIDNRNESTESAGNPGAPRIPVFICGHPKSGTTLLTALLDGHSELVAFPEETGYWAKLAQDPNISPKAMFDWLIKQSDCRNLALGKADISLKGNRDYSDFDFASFQSVFKSLVPATSARSGKVLESLIAAYADLTHQSGKTYWIEKTPNNERYLPTILQHFPEARAIYIVRDPRDVYVSHVRKKERESKDLPIETLLFRWGISVWTWRQFLSQGGNGLTIRYEDLLRYPGEVMATVAHFLEIEYEPILEKPSKMGILWRGNSAHGDRFEGISTKPIGRWREGLNEDLLKIIEGFLGHAMTTFDYRLAKDPISLLQALRLWMNLKQKKQLLTMLIMLYYPFALPKRWRLRFGQPTDTGNALVHHCQETQFHRVI